MTARAAPRAASRAVPRSTAPVTSTPSERRAAALGPLVLDSSCWLAWLTDAPGAERFATALQRPERLIVPVITIYEVTQKLRREAGDDVAWQALSLMQQGRVVELSLPLALQATGNGLPMADSLIYATAQAHSAELWTQDAHFKGLPGVRLF